MCLGHPTPSLVTGRARVSTFTAGTLPFQATTAHGVPLTGPTRVQMAKVGLLRARPVEGMAEVLSESFKHKTTL